jgi:DNA-binding NtrC family response regulator
MDMTMGCHQHARFAPEQAATVLVVEDEPLVREPIAEYLRDCGYRVLEAGDADEAMHLVETVESVGVVFSDVRMPGEMDGFGLAKWMQARHPEVPVLLTSGYYAVPSLSEGPPGDVKLIAKPYSQRQVLGRIRDLLNPHR